MYISTTTLLPCAIKQLWWCTLFHIISYHIISYRIVSYHLHMLISVIWNFPFYLTGVGATWYRLSSWTPIQTKSNFDLYWCNLTLHYITLKSQCPDPKYTSAPVVMVCQTYGHPQGHTLHKDPSEMSVWLLAFGSYVIRNPLCLSMWRLLCLPSRLPPSDRWQFWPQLFSDKESVRL